MGKIVMIKQIREGKSLITVDFYNVKKISNHLCLISKKDIKMFILLNEKFLRFDWLRAVVFQFNLKYLHVKITKPLQVVV